MHYIVYITGEAEKTEEQAAEGEAGKSDLPSRNVVFTNTNP